MNFLRHTYMHTAYETHTSVCPSPSGCLCVTCSVAYMLWKATEATMPALCM